MAGMIHKIPVMPKNARWTSPLDSASRAEAMVTAASAFVLPVTRIDGVQLGDGKCGPITRKLRETYIEFARNSAI